MPRGLPATDGCGHAPRAARQQVARLTGRTPFDIALVELGLPDGRGLDLIRQIERLAAGAESIATRELDILRLSAQGKTGQQMVQQLGVSAHTVATYVKNAYRKLHLSTRAHAIHGACCLGLLA